MNAVVTPPSQPVARFSPHTTESCPIAFLIEPSPDVERCAAPLLAARGFDVRVVHGIPDNLDEAAFVIVEADRGGRTITLARRVRALRPELPTAGVLRWWNEDESELARLAQFVLHVPVRDDQLQALGRVAAAAAAASPA